MSEKTPLVSIITGYYNRAAFVDESIQSLCDQTYQNIEIIIFDDCSTDGTYEKLVRFERKDPRVKVIRHEKNKGFVQGLMDAISISKGDFIAIHGSGDFSYPERIEKQCRLLSERPDVGAVGSYVENVFNKNGKEEIVVYGSDLDGDVSEILKEKNIYTHGEVMLRRSALEKAGGYRNFFVYAQDYDLWSRMTFVCHFFTIKEILYRRYNLADGATTVKEKRLRQLLLAAVIKNNIQRHQNGETDLVEKFGTEAISHISYVNPEFLKQIFRLTLGVFLNKGKASKTVVEAINLILKQSQNSNMRFWSYLLFNITPEKAARKLLRNYRFRNHVIESVK